MVGGAVNGDRSVIEAEDATVSGRFREYVQAIAIDAGMFADKLGRAIASGVQSQVGADDAYAVFWHARRWEQTTWAQFQSTVRGLRPELRHLWPGPPTFPPGDGETLFEAEVGLREIARRLSEAAGDTRSVLMMPGPIRPPDHARLITGVNGKKMAEELTALYEAGIEKITRGAALRGWVREVSEQLRMLQAVLGSPDPGIQFRALTEGMAAADNPLVRDPTSLTHAYARLGLAYVLEVSEKMTDYAEAAGQSSHAAGNTYKFFGTTYVGQIADKIININSTIQNVLDKGDVRIADGLKAVEEAVLTDQAIDDEKREDLIDQLQFLAESAQQEPAKRNRGVIKGALAALGVAAATGAEVNHAMTNWGEVLHTLIP